MLAPKLKLVKPQEKVGNRATTLRYKRQRPKIDTPWKPCSCTRSMNAICRVGGQKAPLTWKSLAVDDSTTLEEARKLIHLEFDEVDVPEDFRFVYGRHVPGSRSRIALLWNASHALILAVKPVEGKLKVGSAVVVDGTPGTIERIRKSGRG